MNFYTGLSSIMLFETLFQLLKPYLHQLTYWRGSKRATFNPKAKRTFNNSTQKKLTYKDEFLMVLMRLRLGLLNEDLADRFNCY